MRLALVLACTILPFTVGAATVPAQSEAAIATAAVPTHIVGVRMLEHNNAVVVLAPKDGAVWLPIFIGAPEAQAIQSRLNNEKAPRPMTHDLLDATVTALGASVERVDVLDLRDNTFIGQLSLRDKSGKLVKIDARPSDCIALAARARLPIMVAPSVLVAAGIDPVE
jgi:bifunctional DNase/RNase